MSLLFGLWLFFTLLVSPFSLGEAKTPAAENRPTGRIEMSEPPKIKPQSLPVQPNPGGGSALSVDTAGNDPDGVRFTPYNTFPKELDLWNLEGKRFVRSVPVVSPDKSRLAYSEVLFVPNLRQTISRLYLVDIPPPPPSPQPHLPSEDALYPASPANPATSTDRFNPDKTVKDRQMLAEVGYQRVAPYDFKTLTVVDWSATGGKLLFKERNGILHVGLRTSDILIYHASHGTVTIYPEVHRAIEYYWRTRGNLPQVERVVWDIQPLGWEPGSDAVVLLKAWAYDKKEKKFLGLWQYDVDAERTKLLLLTDDPYPVAANGYTAEGIPPSLSSKKRH